MELPIEVYRVITPEGWKDLVSFLPHEPAFEGGLAAEAIIGGMRRLLEPGEAITPEVFVQNRVFVDFMQGIIARRITEHPGLITEARRQGEGWVYIIDQRTRTPGGTVPPEDVVGAFEVKGGQVVRGSYRANPRHRILTVDGFFHLGPELHAWLVEELTRLVEERAEARRQTN